MQYFVWEKLGFKFYFVFFFYLKFYFVYPVMIVLRKVLCNMSVQYTCLVIYIYIPLWRCKTTRAWPPHSRGFPQHTQRRTTVGRTPLDESSQRPPPDNTQHSQQTNIHAPGGIRTYDLSRRAAADLRLRPRGHWDRNV